MRFDELTGNAAIRPCRLQPRLQNACALLSSPDTWRLLHRQTQGVMKARHLLLDEEDHGETHRQQYGVVMCANGAGGRSVVQLLYTSSLRDVTVVRLACCCQPCYLCNYAWLWGKTSMLTQCVHTINRTSASRDDFMQCKGKLVCAYLTLSHSPVHCEMAATGFC